jgi:hypothetical protein
MPIDAGIYGQFAEPARSTADYQAQYDSQAQRQMQLQQNRLALMQAQQADQDRNGLRDYVQGGQFNPQDPASLAQIQARFGQAGGAFIQGLDKSAQTRAAARESAAKAGKDEQSTLDAQRLNNIRQIISLDPDTADQMLSSYVTAGKVPMQVASAYQRMIKTDPNWKLNLLMSELDPTKSKELLAPHLQTKNYGGFTQNEAVDPITGKVTVTNTTQNTQDPNSVASVGATLQGQQLTDKRERELAGARLAQERNLAGRPVYDAERAVVVAPGSATATPVMMGGAPLGAKEKDLTEGQSKALMFGSKMQQAANVLDEVGKTADMRGAIKGTAMAVGGMVPFIGDKVSRAAGTLTNVTQSQAQQRYETAKYQWIAGQLRKESGAVIGPQEYQDADEHYFPQHGDDAVTKADKAKQRKLAEQTMLAEVPEKKRPKATGGNTDFVGVNSSQSDIFSAADAILSGRK